MQSNSTIVRRRRERRLIQNQVKMHRLNRFVMLFVLVLFFSVFVLLGGGAAAAVGIYIYYARDLPNPDDIVKAKQQFETTLIYDRTGQTLLYQVIDPSGGDRQSVPLAEIPSDLLNATIAIEDKTFFENPGFDIRGIVRSVWVTVQGGNLQGGSTITQQLVKNILIAPHERTAITLDRKIKEIILSGEISRRYGKEQILEWYLNNNFYGNLAYGIDTASKVYFGKPVRDLTLGEAAMLAAIPQNPQLNPLDNPTAARQRQAVVLDSMVALGLISEQQATDAASQPIVIQPITERYGIVAPHFSVYARRQAEQLLDAQDRDGALLVLQGGLRIYTTLDLDLQYQTECAARGYITRIQGESPSAAPNTTDGKPCVAAQYLPTSAKLKLGVPRNVSNAAVVTLRPSTGEIVSMVGSLDYWNAGIDGNYNAALGLRQPGSAFKPIAYVTAFASTKYMPSTMVLDVPTTFNQGGTPYTPKNEDDKFHGPVSVRDALANSYNIPAVQVLSNVGIGQVIRKAHQLGINSLNSGLDQYGLALALGSGEVSLLDLTYAYTVFANLGSLAGTPVQNPRTGYRAFDPIAILRIEDKEGNVLWQLDEKKNTFGRQSVLQDALAYLINNILSDNQARLPAFGPGNALELSRPAAAKTGTTNDNRDAWTVGYTPQLVTGVWVGNNNNSPMGPDLSGSTAASPIWHAIMEYAFKRPDYGSGPQDWKRPATIIEVPVCKTSGLLPTAECQKVKDLFYADANVSTVPTQQDIYWRRYQINSRNGLIATAFTSADLVTERVYFDFPPEARDWAKANGQPIPPTEYDSGSAQPIASAGSITSPGGLALVHSLLDVKGTLDSEDVVSYTLAYGAGVNPSQWISITGGDPKARGQNLLLGRWDTNTLDGLYTLRLNLVLKDKSLQPHTVQVTVDNHPPTIRVLSPRPGETIGATGDSTVKLSVDAIDNFEMDRVEFYRNNQLIETVKSAPYEIEWRIDQTGAQSFTMVAYDTAGNSTPSENIKVNIQGTP